MLKEVTGPHQEIGPLAGALYASARSWAGPHPALSLFYFELIEQPPGDTQFEVSMRSDVGAIDELSKNMNVKVFESLSAIPDAIADHFSFPAQQDFFLSLDWFSCLFDTVLHDSMTPRIYCLLDDKQDAAGLLFCGTHLEKKTLFSLTNFYTMAFAPVSLSDAIPLSVVLENVIDHIRTETPRWEIIDFRFMQNDLLEKTQLTKTLGKSGFYSSTFFMYENWYLELFGRDFDTYFSSRPSRLRNTIKRKENKLRKTHSYEITLHKTPGPGLEQATKDYVNIYNKSWKHPEPFPEFIPRLILDAAKLGLLRLGILYINSKAAAAQLWITTDNKATIYKLAYSEEYAEFSPGSILSREMFRHAIDNDNVKEIDYGVGSENYKKEWMESVREIKGLQAFNKKTIKGLTLSTAEYLTTIAKRIKNHSP